MPQPDNLVELSQVFTLGTSSGVEDSAEFSVWGQLNFTPATSTDWDTALGNLAQFAADTWSSDVSTTPYSNGAGLLHTRAARCNTSGHTVNEAIKTPADPWTGNSGSNSLPWEVSCCVSLYTYEPGTFIANAANRRGRVYLPPLNVSVFINTKSGEPSITDVESLRDEFAAWLSAVQGHAIAESEQVWSAGVRSTSRKSNPSYAGEWHPVTHLRVDNKLDAQRRRERQQSAVVSVVAFP